jgi:hypothetical protein
MRENGLQRPFSGMQLATWFLLPILVAEFVIFCRPLFPLRAWIPITCVFGLLSLASAMYAYITSKINPMDDRLFPQLLHCPSPRKSAEPERTNGLNPDHTKYCWVCEAQVHVLSMHCKYCDKCVGTFDHHCLWLNTCVGAANYKYFFRTVWVTLLLSILHFGSLCVVVILFFLNIWGVKERAKDWFHLNQPAAVIGVNIAFLPITLGAVMLLVQLWVFHIGIQWEGITTYQYIVRFNSRKRDHDRLETEINNKRALAIQRAVKDGLSLTVCQLQLGTLCRPCDPIRRAVMDAYDRQILHPYGHNGGGQDSNYDENEDHDDEKGDEPTNTMDKRATRESRYDKYSREDGQGADNEKGSTTLEKKSPSQADYNPQQRGSNGPYDERDEISLEGNNGISVDHVDRLKSPRLDRHQRSRIHKKSKLDRVPDTPKDQITIFDYIGTVPLSSIEVVSASDFMVEEPDDVEGCKADSKTGEHMFNRIQDEVVDGYIIPHSINIPRPDNIVESLDVSHFKMDNSLDDEMVESSPTRTKWRYECSSSYSSAKENRIPSSASSAPVYTGTPSTDSQEGPSNRNRKPLVPKEIKVYVSAAGKDPSSDSADSPRTVTKDIYMSPQYTPRRLQSHLSV